MNFIEELKRRNVIRVGFAYAVIAWVITQVADLALENFGAPLWVMKTLMFLTLIGFIVAVFIAWAYEITPEGIKRESEVDRDDSTSSYTGRKLDRMIILVMLLAVSLLLAQRYLFDPAVATSPQSPAQLTTKPIAQEKPLNQTAAAGDSQITPAPARKQSKASLAVLPFVNMSADADNEYFSDGISEELLNQLVKVKGLRVPSRTSSFAFKGKNTDIKEIARQLSVEHILEGSVRKSGNQVRITAQLIDVSTDTHLWAETYDRTLDNIFAIQDEISREIVKQLKISLTDSGLISRDNSKPTENLDAYQDYLRGHYLYTQRGIPSLQASLKALQSAVAKDPEFSQAWAALSLTASTLPSWGVSNPELYNPIAINAGERALSLDSQSDSARAALGMVYSSMGQWTKAQDFYTQISVATRDAEILYRKGLNLQAFGYLQAARKSFLAAEDLDPVYPQLQAFLGQNTYILGDSKSAQGYFQNAIAGDNRNGLNGMYVLSLAEGNVDKAGKYLLAIHRLDSAYETTPASEKRIEMIIAAFNDPSLIAAGIQAGLAEENGDALAYFDAEAEIMQLLNRWWKNERVNVRGALFTTIWSPVFSKLRGRDDFKQWLKDIGLVAFWKTNGWPDLCKPVGEDDFECD